MTDKTNMRAAMERAGVNIAESRMYVLACEMLRLAEGDVWKITHIVRRAAADMQDKPEGASQARHESRMATDLRPSPATDNDGSQQASESQHLDDPTVETPAQAGEPPTRDGSQLVPESQRRDDPAPAPARSKISKAAGRKVARTIWDRRLGVSDITLKTATRHHFETLLRKGIVVEHVARRFLTEIDWPNDHTPLPACADQRQVKAIFDSAHEVLDAMGMTRPAPRPATGASHAK